MDLEDMYDLNEILIQSAKETCIRYSFYSQDRPPCYRVDGVLSPVVGERLTPETLKDILLDPVLDTRHNEELQKKPARQISLTPFPGVGRFRVNVFLQRGTLCICYALPAF